jgi:hypothetical protein
MATNRFQFSDDFVLKNGKVGINSADPQAKLDVRGLIKTDNLTSIGIATFAAYEGFLRSDYNIDETVSFSDGSALSGEIIVGTGITATNASVDSAGQGTIESLKIYNTFTVPTGGTADRPTKAKLGMLYYNKDFGTIEFFDGDRWRQVDNTTTRGRGVLQGGDRGTGDRLKVSDYVNITTTGNALNFGTLTSNSGGGAGCSSEIRGLFAYGYLGSGFAGNNTVEYITIASEGNAIDFGDISVARGDIAACSSSSRGIFAGGYTNTPAATNSNVIDYIQISTIGNALDFGDLTRTQYNTSGCSSPTRGIFSGNIQSVPATTYSSSINSITISSTGNAVQFGNLTDVKSGCGSLSNSVRGVVGGGSVGSYLNTIEYITISSFGNAQDFGDLTASKQYPHGTSNSIRGIFVGGIIAPSRVNNIDYITIASIGNAQDFGDLTTPRSQVGAVSDSHGGLGGF